MKGKKMPEYRGMEQKLTWLMMGGCEKITLPTQGNVLINDKMI